VDRIQLQPGIIATKHYALYLEEPRAAVVSDLHLGYEGALHDQGISIPRRQKKVMVERLDSLLLELEPKILVVAGDFKHEFSRPLREEWNEVLDVLDFLKGRTEVLMVRGNHDNFLRNILNRKGMDLHRQVTLGGVKIVHGHEEVPIEGPTIIGHEHPSLKLKDEIGASVSLPCFLALRQLVVLPAFSPLAYGTDIFQRPYLSPILNKLKMGSARVIGVDDKLGLLDFGQMDRIRN
jgi:putative SbcD/Mre11-related phosphoesterase